MHLLLRNCHVISPVDGINGRFDILIQGGVITRMGVVWQHVRECIQYDLSGRIIVPGFFDMHVHFREPGQTHKETIASGALSAAYGGFTGVLMMPNTEPPIDSPEIIFENKRRAGNSIIDIFTSACATIGRKGKAISDINSLVNSGALAITDDGNPIEDDSIMEKLFEKSQELGFTVVQHCEVKSISKDGVINKGAVSERLGLKGISNESEYKLIERDLYLLRKYPSARYHVQHISAKESVKLVRTAKSQGLNVTAEVCPHHFILTDEAVEKYGTDSKMNPPLRSPEDVKEVLKGISDGTIDVICTDHAPHTETEKAQPMEKAPFGIVGLETAVPLTYTFLVDKGIISLDEMIKKMSVNPRKILNLPEIKICEGEIANLTILNTETRWQIDKNLFHSKSNNTPFHGWEVLSKAEGIVNREKFLINV